jgi:AcrR family transcriptional regulator
MARLRSPEKRSAILQAAVHEIAESGLGASTAKIAKRAGLAEGTLFTYFPTKEELLNELYVELKAEVYSRLNTGFPHKAGLERRVRHVWCSFLNWGIEFPEKRKTSVLLNVSDVVTAESRARTASARGPIDATLSELESRKSLHGLPKGFAAAAIASMQEAAMELIMKQPKQREAIIERTFKFLWRALE